MLYGKTGAELAREMKTTKPITTIIHMLERKIIFPEGGRT